MAHFALQRLLLQSDRHPPRSVGLADLGGASDDLRYLLSRGLIYEVPPPTEVDDAVVITVNGGTYLVSKDGSEESECINPDELREFVIDIAAFAGWLRSEMDLAGPAVERVTDRLAFLGSRGEGARREAVHLARGLTSARALQEAAIAKGHDPAQRQTFLTPTKRDLPVAIIRQLGAVGVRVICFFDMLDGSKALSLPPWQSEEKSARLVVDCGGHIARLDGTDLNLPRRVFAVLEVLATEAATEGGIVDRERIATAMERATGHDDRQEEQVTKAISVLRQILKGCMAIEPRRNVGYRLNCEPGEIDVY